VAAAKRRPHKTLHAAFSTAIRRVAARHSDESRSRAAAGAISKPAIQARRDLTDRVTEGHDGWLAATSQIAVLNAGSIFPGSPPRGTPPNNPRKWII
jgi:hypothetical protein